MYVRKLGNAECIKIGIQEAVCTVINTAEACIYNPVIAAKYARRAWTQLEEPPFKGFQNYNLFMIEAAVFKIIQMIFQLFF